MQYQIPKIVLKVANGSKPYHSTSEIFRIFMPARAQYFTHAYSKTGTIFPGLGRIIAVIPCPSFVPPSAFAPLPGFTGRGTIV